MKLLFIDPMGDKESTGLNIGIAYCGAALRKSGHVVGVLDLVNIRKDDPIGAIKTAVESFRPDVIGLSVTNMSFNNCRAYVESIKKYFSGIVLVGGPEISALIGKSLELIPGADMAIYGEGERTLVELLSAIETKAPLNSDQGPGMAGW